MLSNLASFLLHFNLCGDGANWTSFFLIFSGYWWWFLVASRPSLNWKIIQGTISGWNELPIRNPLMSTPPPLPQSLLCWCNSLPHVGGLGFCGACFSHFCWYPPLPPRPWESCSSLITCSSSPLSACVWKEERLKFPLKVLIDEWWRPWDDTLLTRSPSESHSHQSVRVPTIQLRFPNLHLFLLNKQRKTHIGFCPLFRYEFLIVWCHPVSSVECASWKGEKGLYLSCQIDVKRNCIGHVLRNSWDLEEENIILSFLTPRVRRSSAPSHTTSVSVRLFTQSELRSGLASLLEFLRLAEEHIIGQQWFSKGCSVGGVLRAARDCGRRETPPFPTQVPQVAVPGMRKRRRS